jgi:hypothetical protein
MNGELDYVTAAGDTQSRSAEHQEIIYTVQITPNVRYSRCAKAVVISM